jgi:hypothetical protein
LFEDLLAENWIVAVGLRDPRIVVSTTVPVGETPDFENADTVRYPS